jgi:hypothetical protein
MYKFKYLILLCSVAAIVAGCGTASDTSNKSNAPCSDGPEVACTCDNGQTGTMQCLNDGYTMCSCGAAGSEAETTGNATTAVTTSTGGSAASSTGAGGAYAATTRTDSAGSTAKTGQTAGSGGSATKATKITCPSPLKCESNEALNGYLDAGPNETIRFCANPNQGIFDMANAGPTPPTCKSDRNCEAIALEVKCTSFDIGGMVFSGCMQTGCQ